jgi:hypothetical protein
MMSRRCSRKESIVSDTPPLATDLGVSLDRVQFRAQKLRHLAVDRVALGWPVHSHNGNTR